MRYKMKISRRLMSGCIVALIALLSMAIPVPLQAATTGYSATWNTGLLASGNFIDAAKFGGTDACQKINNALASITTAINGAVVDARGLTSGLTCSASPWVSPNVISNSVSSVILLPAATIKPLTTWVIPNNTQLIGEGGDLTIIEDGTGAGLNPVLLMGDTATVCNSAPCFGISIEELAVKGNTANTTGIGIQNQSAQEHSYVRNVSITGMQGAGLDVSNFGAQNSGPYENLQITAGSGSSSMCINLGNGDGPATLRSVHGITCKGSGVSPIGIRVNVSNTVISEVNVSGFTTGIMVGHVANLNDTNLYGYVQDDVLMNIQGLSGTGTMTNLIELSKAGNCPSGGCMINCHPTCVTVQGTNVTDITLIGIRNLAATNTINDQLTGTSGTLIPLSTPNVALYILGQPMNASLTPITQAYSQNSRFTTAPIVPSWGMGTTGLTSGSSPCSVIGALYSNYAGAAGHNLYACVPAASGNVWTAF